VKDLCGVAEISPGTCAELSAGIRAANRPGRYLDVLRKRANIELAICDIGWAGETLDPSLFRAVIRMDDFLVPTVAPVEKRFGGKISTLADWEAALDKACQQAKRAKYVGIKSGIAYARTLDFEEIARPDAEASFTAALEKLGKLPREQWLKEAKPFQDYIRTFPT
jgi:hypothetical protein